MTGLVLWLLACGADDAPDPGSPPVEPVPDAPVAPLAEDPPPTARMQTYLEMWEDRQTPRSEADGQGRVWLIDSPEQVEAGQPVQLQVGFEVGEGGIAEGGAIVFLPSPFWGWSPPQASTPEAPGYVVVESDHPEVRLVPRAAGQMLSIEVHDAPLPPGAKLRWVYGAGIAKARVDRFAEREGALWVSVDGDGDGVRAVVPEPAAIRITAGPPVRLLATLPSTAEPGTPVRLTLAALDAKGNAFRGTDDDGEVRLSMSDGVDGPAAVRLSDEGLAEVVLTPTKPGVVAVRAEGPGSLSGRSNPMVVRAGIEPVLWGDLQIHSALSDGTGVPADLYRYAREVAALDVAAITDHDRWGMRFLVESEPSRQRLADATQAANAPGRFVAVHGWEWTNWVYGHRHVLGFSDTPVPVYSSLDPAYDAPEELWAALQDRDDVLTVAHHSAGGPVAVDWSFRPPAKLEPVTEIASVHGHSEAPDTPGAIYDAVPGNFVVDQLRDGLTVGFIGSTDGHDGHPGMAHLAGGKGGLAAIVGAEPTRTSVLEALRDRRTYATNGVRMLLRFDVDGVSMGGELDPPAEPVQVQVRAVGTAPIDRVELVRAAGVVGSVRGEGRSLLHHTWTLDDLPAGDFVYVRVLQLDGGIGWSSPVYVR